MNTAELQSMTDADLESIHDAVRFERDVRLRLSPPPFVGAVMEDLYAPMTAFHDHMAAVLAEANRRSVS